MAAKKLFTQIFIYFSKPLRLLYSLIIYEIVNFSFFTLYSLLLLSFFLYLKSVPINVIVHVLLLVLSAACTPTGKKQFPQSPIHQHSQLPLVYCQGGQPQNIDVDCCSFD